MVACSASIERGQGASFVGIDNVRVPHLGLTDLLASKRTGRPADQTDIEVLKRLRR